MKVPLIHILAIHLEATKDGAEGLECLTKAEYARKMFEQEVESRYEARLKTVKDSHAKKVKELEEDVSNFSELYDKKHAELVKLRASRATALTKETLALTKTDFYDFLEKQYNEATGWRNKNKRKAIGQAIQLLNELD